MFSTLALSGVLVGVQPTQDTVAVHGCAEDYIQGWYSADGNRMKNAVHPVLSKCRVLPNGSFQATGASRLIQRTNKGIGQRPKDQRIADISLLDMSDRHASVLVISAEFFDFLSLVRAEGGWRILNVVWDYHNAVEQGSLEELKKPLLITFNALGVGTMLCWLRYCIHPWPSEG